MTRLRSLQIIACFALALASGCSHHPAINVDACTLLTSGDIQAVQGAAVQENKSTSVANGGMLTSQCYYASSEPNKSVSVALTQNDPAAQTRRSPSAFWNETFGRFQKGEKEAVDEGEKKKQESLQQQRHEQAEEDEARPPKRIEGVGDEAFWSPSRVGGALYVLKKNRDAYLRISVGGPGNEQEKIDKSRKLALKALERL